ncbi:helix-turn-helix transcriptional regulator [Rhizobium tumorigenes]|uniref:helix-turn-helix transcriptional regulator n=1 Tax=Rhizobium tumorigenes TaxID=2041385 RepID=UPI00241FB999|nr:helix-turn-helix transcriptional regulator [Rhizobium tumorigenes]WFR99557.1 helix-turn-helix transcriptional regulator [Rhizobium tumorigenes]
MDTTSEITRTLRAARALVGLSQEELAEASGVSRQIIARMERGEQNVLLESIQQTRAALEHLGIVFIASDKTRGPGVAERRTAQP